MIVKKFLWIWWVTFSACWREASKDWMTEKIVKSRLEVINLIVNFHGYIDMDLVSKVPMQNDD